MADFALNEVTVSAGPTPTGTGQLTVTLSGLPSGMTGDVVVTMGSYTQTIAATTTLSSLAPGTYTVTASPASNGNAIVPNMYDGSVSPPTVAVVNNGAATTTVRYTVRPGSGQLWFPGFVSAEAESLASGTLTTTGPAKFDVTLTSGTNAAESIAFDHAGNMWVADERGHVYRYDAAELASSGAQAPAVTIDATAYGTGSGAITGLAFDTSGDLWVAAGFGSQLLEYAPAQLASGGTLTPAVVLSATNNRLDGPSGIAFDASGNLWVANEYIGGTVLRFDASDITTTGSPTPSATLTSSSNWEPTGLAFDASGALWVADVYSHDLLRFTDPDTLTSNVTPTPDVKISGSSNFDVPFLAFSPPPANLPIDTP